MRPADRQASLLCQLRSWAMRLPCASLGSLPPHLKPETYYLLLPKGTFVAESASFTWLNQFVALWNSTFEHKT